MTHSQIYIYFMSIISILDIQYDIDSGQQFQSLFIIYLLNLMLSKIYTKTINWIKSKKIESMKLD